MEPGAQPTPCLEGKTTSVSFPNGRILHARPPSYRGTAPSSKKLRHQFSTGCLATGLSLALALLVVQRALHLALGLAEILLDLALSLLVPTFHMFARVGGTPTKVTTKPVLGFLHLALRLDLETALADRHTILPLGPGLHPAHWNQLVHAFYLDVVTACVAPNPNGRPVSIAVFVPVNGLLPFLAINEFKNSIPVEPLAFAFDTAFGDQVHAAARKASPVAPGCCLALPGRSGVRAGEKSPRVKYPMLHSARF